jgi:hypothetical protein
MASSKRQGVSSNQVVQNIHVTRGHKVLLDSELAALYQVQTKVLNQAVQRNIDRFPADFMFQLSAPEFENWRSQFGDGLSISVEGMTVAGDAGPKADKSRCPKQDGCRVGAGPATAQHLTHQAAH